MSKFSLAVRSFTPPTLPDRPADAPPSAFRSGLIPSVASAISPLCFTVSLSSARDTNPLYPASHLQLSYFYESSGEIFIPNVITSKDLVNVGTEAEPNLYEIQAPAEEIPRAKVNDGTTSTAEVRVYAWKGEKLLGKWVVGQVESLGLEGLKSFPLALLRQKTWQAQGGTR